MRSVALEIVGTCLFFVCYSDTPNNGHSGLVLNTSDAVVGLPLQLETLICSMYILLGLC